MLNRLDMALLIVPTDMANCLIAFGADQALIWTGQEPNRDEFYFQLGRLTARLSAEAWERKLGHVDRTDSD